MAISCRWICNLRSGLALHVAMSCVGVATACLRTGDCFGGVSRFLHLASISRFPDAAPDTSHGAPWEMRAETNESDVAMDCPVSVVLGPDIYWLVTKGKVHVRRGFV